METLHLEFDKLDGDSWGEIQKSEEITCRTK